LAEAKKGDGAGITDALYGACSRNTLTLIVSNTVVRE
jgi:hypothetical protein